MNKKKLIDKNSNVINAGNYLKEFQPYIHFDDIKSLLNMEVLNKVNYDSNIIWNKMMSTWKNNLESQINPNNKENFIKAKKNHWIMRNEDKILVGSYHDNGVLKVSVVERGPKYSSAKRDIDDEYTLEELLNVSSIVNAKLKGERIQTKLFNEKEKEYANKILVLNKKNQTKDKAEEMINQLNHRIVMKNKVGRDIGKSKKLYNDLMK